MKKPIIAVIAIVALLITLSQPWRPARAANTGSYNGTSFFITATGTASATLTIPTTATQCDLFVGAGASAGGGLTDQYESSTGVYSAATGHPQVTQPGEYISTIPTGAIGFRLYATNFAGPYASGQLVCGAVMPPSFISIYGGYGVPSPLPLASVATGTTAYVYAQLQSVTGTCNWAPDGCYAIVTEDLMLPAVAPTAAGPLNPCIFMSGSPSPLPSTIFLDAAPAATPSAGVPCASSVPSPWGNALAGNQPFAFATTGVALGETSLTSDTKWEGILTPGQAYTFLCDVEGATTTSITVVGSCSVKFLAF